MIEPPVQFDLPRLKAISAGKALAGILLLSTAVLGFLVWLIYIKPGSAPSSRAVSALPAINAGLNSLSAGFLVAGYHAIRQRKYQRHIKLMLAALVSSALFFTCYVVYHTIHGDTKFLAHGLIRPVYFFVLITHIALSAIAVPMILGSFYLSLSGRLVWHRRLSRVTLPIWLYVSLTGVLVFALLKWFNHPS